MMRSLPIGAIENRGDMDGNIELILAARGGDDCAFRCLCEQYNNLIDSMSRKYSAICSEEYSSYDDFLQEAKMAFYKAVVRYDVENKNVTFGAFAKVCIRNSLVSCVRRQNSKKRRKGEGGAAVEDNWSPQDTVVRRELGEKLIYAAEKSLSKYERRILSLYMEGKRIKEISTILCRDVKSVNNAIYRIRLKLKRTVIS